MSEHTPGPWKVDSKYCVGPVSQEDDQSYGMIIPVADVYGPNRKADAELIASAPQLREQNRVLAEAVIWALGYHDFRERQEGEGPYWWRRELMHRSGLTQGDLDQAMRLDETAEQLTDIMLQHKKKAALTATSQEGQHGSR